MKPSPGPVLVTETEPTSAAAEAYRTLRTNLLFSGLAQDRKRLLITSATPGEGKTTTVVNLGVALAQSGGRICLVDSDLRRPGLHRVFGLGKAVGLTTALVEGKAPGEVAVPTRVPNLFVVTSGPQPPNPVELLGSPRMRGFAEALAGSFDTVLFDSPPVITVADASVLASVSDGVLLVLWAGRVPHDVIRRAAEQLEAVKATLVGVLLNRVDLRRDGYYYQYYRYSYYGYASKP